MLGVALYTWTSKYEFAAIGYIPCKKIVLLLDINVAPGYVDTNTLDHVVPFVLYLPINCITPDDPFEEEETKHPIK